MSTSRMSPWDLTVISTEGGDGRQEGDGAFGNGRRMTGSMGVGPTATQSNGRDLALVSVKQCLRNWREQGHSEAKRVV